MYSTLERVCGKMECKSKEYSKPKKSKKPSVYSGKKVKPKKSERSYYLEQAQISVNRYVRLRDRGKPCISCDKPYSHLEERHASHYKSVGSNSALRFNLWNIHASCVDCNIYLSGNIENYTPRLMEKIGKRKVDWLLAQNHPVKYNIDYLKRLKSVFDKKATEKLKNLRRENEINKRYKDSTETGVLQ